MRSAIRVNGVLSHEQRAKYVSLCDRILTMQKRLGFDTVSLQKTRDSIDDGSFKGGPSAVEQFIHDHLDIINTAIKAEKAKKGN